MKKPQFRISPIHAGHYVFERNDWAGSGGVALWRILSTHDDHASAQTALDVAEGRMTKEAAAKLRVARSKARKVAAQTRPIPEINTITEYGLTQRLSRSIKVF